MQEIVAITVPDALNSSSGSMAGIVEEVAAQGSKELPEEVELVARVGKRFHQLEFHGLKVKGTA